MTSSWVTVVASVPPTQTFITVQKIPSTTPTTTTSQFTFPAPVCSPDNHSRSRDNILTESCWNNDDVDDVESILSAIYAQREEKGKINDNLLFIPECMGVWMCAVEMFIAQLDMFRRGDWKGWNEMRTEIPAGRKAHLLV